MWVSRASLPLFFFTPHCISSKEAEGWWRLKPRERRGFQLGFASNLLCTLAIIVTKFVTFIEAIGQHYLLSNPQDPLRWVLVSHYSM